MQFKLLTQDIYYKVFWSSPEDFMTNVVTPVSPRCLLNQDRCLTRFGENEVLRQSAGREDLCKALSLFGRQSSRFKLKLPLWIVVKISNIETSAVSLLQACPWASLKGWGSGQMALRSLPCFSFSTL